jgi:hypothetical protein
VRLENFSCWYKILKLNLCKEEKAMSKQSDIDQLLLKSRDLSNLDTLSANAKNPLPNEAELKSLNEAAIRTQIDQIKQYALLDPDGQLVQANRALLDQEEADHTYGIGTFEIASGFGGWAIKGALAFPSLIPLTFEYAGSGSSLKAWGTGVTATLGSFVKDPNEICLSDDFRIAHHPIYGKVRVGRCNFEVSGGGLGVSGVHLTFYSTSGTYWGTATGTGLIAGGFSFDGFFDLIWKGWKNK